MGQVPIPDAIDRFRRAAIEKGNYASSTAEDEVTPAEFASAKEQFRAELVNERRGRFFAAYMGKLKEKLNVEVKSDVVKRITSALSL